LGVSSIDPERTEGLVEETIRVFVDPRAPGSEQLMEELEKQLRALDIGSVDAKKEKPPEGTLAPDPATVIIILKIAFWSFKVGKIIFDIIKDVREQRAATLKQPLEEVPGVFVAIGAKAAESIELPASVKKQEQYLEAVTPSESKK
jgi:hypothetical protein